MTTLLDTKQNGRQPNKINVICRSCLLRRHSLKNYMVFQNKNYTVVGTIACQLILSKTASSPELALYFDKCGTRGMQKNGLHLGALECQKHWSGHASALGIISPPDWNRFNLSAKIWKGLHSRVPTSPFVLSAMYISFVLCCWQVENNQTAKT